MYTIFVPELYEISPYAQFAIGFRTFGHVDNQEAPTRMHLPGNSKARYDSGKGNFFLRYEQYLIIYINGNFVTKYIKFH